MKIFMESKNWPWPVEKYRYPIEQMLITLFPEEKFEYLHGEPEGHFPAMGDMHIEFIRDDRNRFKKMEGEELARVHVTVHLGPDLKEMPKSDDYCDMEDFFSHWAGGLHSLCGRGIPNILERTEEEVYRAVSWDVKRTIYLAGTRMIAHRKGDGRHYSLPWGCLTGVRPVKLPTRAILAGKTPEEAWTVLTRDYLVNGDRAALAVECAQAALDVNRGLDRDGLALYLGVPFCPTRCAYCSFISSDIKGSLALVEPYVDALCREIQLAGGLLRERGLHISHAYMGGGTPTTLTAEQLHKILSAVENFLPMERCGEFTVEAGRPDTITADKLETLKLHNIHRISINPQTMENHVLRAMGRAHTAAQIVEAMALAERHFGGLVNMDLIAGLPADSLEGFGRTLDQVLAMGPANITVHTLALKKGSRLAGEGLAGAGGGLCPPETVEAMLALASDRLRGAGYAPYYLYRQKYMSGSFENVGWAKPGAVCAYNIVMMEELQSVLSLGAGGITKLVDPENRKIVRLNNPKYAKEYLEGWDKIAAAKEEAADFQAELAGR